MNPTVIHLIRFTALILVQVLILKNIDLGSYAYYFKIWMYPLALLMLPLRLPAGITLTIAFVTGIIVDMFYNSAGMHAGACVAMMFFRPLFVNILEPRGGYDNNPLPNRTKLGTPWFLQYVAFCLAIFVVVYSLYETFLFEKINVAFIKAIFTYIVSFPVIILPVFIFNFGRK